jgi:hypothetical protein
MISTIKKGDCVSIKNKNTGKASLQGLGIIEKAPPGTTSYNGLVAIAYTGGRWKRIKFLSTEESWDIDALPLNSPDGDTLKVGIIGYSSKKYDEDKAANVMGSCFMALAKKEKDKEIAPVEIVSGLTNMGIPGLAYELAEELGFYTVGIACKKAEEYEVYPVNKEIIHGEEWGDESAIFLDYIDILLKFGGGEQSKDEFAKAKKMLTPSVEFDL